MTNFIPIFPLGIVVFPNESLNLHIFEPRYKQMIQECMEQKKMFGIPTVIAQKIGELGTLVRIKEISKTYENGEMDIKTHFAMNGEVHQSLDFPFIGEIIQTLAFKKDQLHLIKKRGEGGYIWDDMIRVDIRGCRQLKWEHLFIRFCQWRIWHIESVQNVGLKKCRRFLQRNSFPVKNRKTGSRRS